MNTRMTPMVKAACMKAPSATPGGSTDVPIPMRMTVSRTKTSCMAMSMISARPREPTRAGRTSTSTASPLTIGSSLPPLAGTATVMRVVNPIGVGYAAPVDLDAYVAERRGEWNRLEVLARRRRLSPDEADELVLLYQRAATHLSVVRSRSPDPVLVAGLSRLVLAARAAITGTRRFSWKPVGRFFTTTLPGELYRSRGWWITVMVVCVVAGTALVQYVAGHPEVPALFMSDSEMNRLVSNDF